MEEWRPVVGFEGFYEVSSLGRIRGLDRVDAGGRRWKGRMMSLTPDSSGYLGCTLRNGRGKYVRACQAVARAFLGPRPLPNWQVAHGPNGQQDNCVSNLRWTSQLENARDRIRHGTQLRGTRIHTNTLSEIDVERIRDLRRSGETLVAIGAWMGTHCSNVSQIARRRTWTHV